MAYYKYTSESVLDYNNHKTSWDRCMFTDQTVTRNKPDINILDKLAKEVTLIDITIPNNNILAGLEHGRVAKFMHIMVSSTRVIRNNLLMNITELILNKHLFKPMQRTVLRACTI